jgi:hypothetical protein
VPNRVASAYQIADIFKGPFVMWESLADPGSETKVQGTDGIWRLAPGITIARRHRRLGEWVEKRHWYIDGLLQPVPDVYREEYGLPAVQVRPLSGSMPMTLECAYLSRPLGEVVAGVDSYADLEARIRKATQYQVRLSLDIDRQRAVCRQIVVLPASLGDAMTSIHPIPTGEIIRQVFGGLTEKYERQRPLDVIAREVAEVYLAAPARPALAVAEHFGWRTPGFPWIADDRARAKVRRACSRAVKLGYLPDAPGERRRRSAPDQPQPIRRRP